MTRTQTIILSLLAGLVAIVFAALATAVLFLPVEMLPVIIVTPTRTATATATVTLTPTLPNFLPTSANIVATFTPTAEPTATNTRVPTVTPRPVSTATPTVVIQAPTVIVIPSATPTNTPRPLPPPTVVAQPTVPPNRPLGYQINFDAEERVVEEGDCTDLTWFVEGSNSVLLDGLPVSPTGRKQVCPDDEETYELSVSLPNSTAFEIRSLTIDVRPEEDVDPEILEIDDDD